MARDMDPSDKLDYGEDDFYVSREDDGAGVIVWAAVMLMLVITLIWANHAFGQEPTYPKPPLDQPRAVTLAFPGLFGDMDREYPPDVVDAIVRTQLVEYLQRVVKSKLPRPQDFKICVIEGGPGPGSVPAVKIGGRVIESAAKVQVRVGSMPYTDAVVVPTMAGYPKTWSWVVPEAVQDGVQRRIYARALRATGTTIALCDNASTTVPWLLQIPSVPPPIVTPPPPPPPPPPVVTTPSISVVGNELVGVNMPAGATKAYFVINGSTGFFDNPTTITSGRFAWNIHNVAAGSVAGYWIRAQDATGKTLWETNGSFVAPPR